MHCENFSIAKKPEPNNICRKLLLLSRLYNHLQMNDSAYFFLQSVHIIKESILNNQFLFKTFQL
jgi:hypothetical protein